MMSTVAFFHSLISFLVNYSKEAAAYLSYFLLGMAYYFHHTFCNVNQFDLSVVVQPMHYSIYGTSRCNIPHRGRTIPYIWQWP